MSKIWGLKTFCVVTGASKGLGREICTQVSRNVGEQSVFLLLARDVEALEETKKLMQSECNTVIVKDIDLASCNEELLRKIFHEVLSDVGGPSKFELSLMIHNAGSLGNISKSVSCYDCIDTLQQYYRLNVFSFAALNSTYLKFFDEKEKNLRIIINISSLAAVAPIDGFGMYCSGKAARESLMKVLAMEMETVKILNYAPGPLQTEMTETIKKDATDTTKKIFNDISFLTCDESVKKLITIIGADQYKSGDRIDYYD